MASSSPPSEKEQTWYYFGLKGCPKLIARTSTDVWSPGRGGNWNESYRHKEFSAIADHDIISKWTKSLSLALVAALDGHPWAWFLPIRIGFESDTRGPAAVIERTECPVVLLIAIDEALPWNTAIAIAFNCRSILRMHQILDVEIEILECGYKPCAASTELEAAIDSNAWMNWPTESAENTNTLALPILSYPGYPVTYLEGPAKQGSVGLHLKLGNDPTVYGLTCRHVVCNDRADDEIYNFTGDNKQRHAQASKRTYGKVLQTFEARETLLRRSADAFQNKKYQWEHWYIHDESKKNRIFTEMDARMLQDFQHKLEYHLEIFELVKEANELESRSIGYLSHHSSLEISAEEPGYLKDWGLIKLDGDKFLKGFQNKVFLGNARDIQDAGGSKLQHALHDGFLSLTLDSRGQDSEKEFWVGKQGGTSGLTLGIRSGIEAVVRKPSAGGRTCISWEAPVISKPGEGKGFTDSGDSGSCIFDMQGRIVGLAVGRAMAGGLDREMKARPGDKVSPEEAEKTLGDVLPQWSWGTDITFSSPIEWVLRDIESFTGSKPRLS